MTDMAMSDAHQLVHRIAEDKVEMESGIYIKFTALLNEKKAKIRLLLEKLSEYRIPFFVQVRMNVSLHVGIEQQYAAFVKYGAPSSADLIAAAAPPSTTTKKIDEEEEDRTHSRERSNSATPSMSDRSDADEDMTE